jgi:hypothetical protein
MGTELPIFVKFAMASPNHRASSQETFASDAAFFGSSPPASPSEVPPAGGAPFTIAAGDGLSLYGCRILRFLKDADFDFTLRILCFDACRSSRLDVRRFCSPH